MSEEVCDQDSKTCARCNDNKRLSEFVRNRTKKSGISSYCKPCHVEYITEYRRNNRERTYSYHRKSTKVYQDSWISYFKSKYGQVPYCEVCGTQLVWHSVNREDNSVCFDHKSGNEIIQSNPKQWINIRPCSDKHKATWDKCDFGILCNRCNSCLPTKNRTEWLLAALNYNRKGKS